MLEERGGNLKTKFLKVIVTVRLENARTRSEEDGCKAGRPQNVGVEGVPPQRGRCEGRCPDLFEMM